MRKSLILIMVVAIGMISLVGFECFAEDVVKVGAVQPITGRFAFAGVQINAGLEDALMMANEDGGINLTFRSLKKYFWNYWKIF